MRHPTHLPAPGVSPLPESFRPIPTRSHGNPCFLVVISIFASIEYVLYLFFILRYAVLGDVVEPSDDYVNSWIGSFEWPWLDIRGQPVHLFGLLYAVAFNFVILMLVFAFIQASCTDPGRVPPHWGFHVGDDNKRRRYCKICNVWKPDRTHHCSACHRCVLNMDHHCPWVNNCIGFYNRKFFIQLLVYGIIGVGCVAAHGAWHIWQLGQQARTGPVDLQFYIEFGLSSICVTCALLLFLPLCPFLRLHILLVLRNSTTIEDLDINTRNRRRFDLGPQRNCAQVMGGAWWLWWIPCHTRASLPHGDGVRWSQAYIKILDSCAGDV